MGILQLKPKGLETHRSEVTEREKALDMLVATWLWATAGVCPQKMAKGSVQLPQVGYFQRLGKLPLGAAENGLFLPSKQGEFKLEKVHREGWPETSF